MKAVELQYLGGPWDGRKEKFETDVQFVTLPVWFDWNNKHVYGGKQHYYSRIERYFVYEGVFDERENK